LSADPSRLTRARGRCWSALLGHEPILDALCELAVAPRPRGGAVPGLCALVRRLRRGDLGVDPEPAIERLIAAILDADADDLWLERVIADLVSLQAGSPADLNLPLDPACRGDPALVAQLTAVRAAYFELGVERQRHPGDARPLPGLPRR